VFHLPVTKANVEQLYRTSTVSTVIIFKEFSQKTEKIAGKKWQENPSAMQELNKVF
jgi:hypothetical protein